MRYRVGRKLQRTIYRQPGDVPADTDELIGIMHNLEDAKMFVLLANDYHKMLHPVRPYSAGPG